MAENRNSNVPPVRDAEAAGMPADQTRDIVDGEAEQSPEAPKLGGAPERGKEPATNPLADRNVEGVRQAGATPRPTEKPIVGGERG